MLIVQAQISVFPHLHDDFVVELRKLVHASREEEGCVSFLMLEQHDDPHTFIMLEQWQDEKALVSHVRSLHVAHFGRAIEPMIQSGKPTHLYHTSKDEFLADFLHRFS
jgi:quinol monooxygenase YgiN